MHGPDRKPARGVCQICGRPVVAYGYEASGGCFHPGPTVINGHQFKNGKLVRVRCDEHEYGIRPNLRELERHPTPEEIELASKIRGAPVGYEAPPPRDPNVLVMPAIGRVYPMLIAADIVAVQPMTKPIVWPWDTTTKPSES